MSDWSAETDLLPVGLAVKEARMHMLRLDIEACQKLVAFPAKAVLQEYSLHRRDNRDINIEVDRHYTLFCLNTVKQKESQ